jgi:hypothetical protein
MRSEWGAVERGAEPESRLPPRLFKHDRLLQAVEDAREVPLDALTNAVNHIHFMDGRVLVLLRHPRYEEPVLLEAKPEPCLGRTLRCTWAEGSEGDVLLREGRFLHLVVEDGLSVILVPGTVQERTRAGITLLLSEAGRAVGERRARRYACQGVDAELIQDGFAAKGALLEFSPLGFHLRLSPEPPCSFRWFNTAEPFSVHLHQKGRMVFSGTCEHIRTGRGGLQREIVVKPVPGGVRRFGKRRMRNIRLRLAPSPVVRFVHPLLKKKVRMDVEDISTSGFSVREERGDRLLLPGMIIPGVTMSFAGGPELECTAQVIHQDEAQAREVRSGLAILDMDIQAYSRLTHMLINTLDPHAHVSSEVDMEALWEFFFSAGFIYPKKYRLVQAHREAFRETYERLYVEDPEVARHFTYQKNGRIYGHISMVRAYSRAWMIHHHAARAMDSKRTGLLVLKQIMYYLNDMYRLPSAGIDYVMAYFRPENAFPDRVFGGFAREVADPGECSMDRFAYLPYTRLSVGARLPGDWTLEACSPFHLWEARRFYERRSGGLLLDALGLRTGDGRPCDEPLKEAYRGSGFLRGWTLYSLARGGELYAVLLADRSDLGFNLSELLNGIKILVTRPGDLPWSILSTAISLLVGAYRAEEVPVLFFPPDYVEARKIPHEKHYNLWVLNVQSGNEYLEYMQKRFRISYG